MALTIQESGIETLTLSTCILKHCNVFITWFTHSIYGKV
jgi:hypothetical protein